MNLYSCLSSKVFSTVLAIASINLSSSTFFKDSPYRLFIRKFSTSVLYKINSDAISFIRAFIYCFSLKEVINCSLISGNSLMNFFLKKSFICVSLGVVFLKSEIFSLISVI